MTVDKSGQRIRQMFGAIAPKYDRMNHLLSLNVDRYWRWRTVRAVHPDGSAPILDVCTGTGDLAIAFWHHTRGTVPVVGTDFCPEMLEIGRAKALRHGAEGRVQFVEADTQQLPFEADSFQVVSVAFGLRNVADTDRGLAEMVRVAQPGGRVAVLEFSMPRRQPMKAVYGVYFRSILPRLGRWLASNDHAAYDYLPASVSQFPEGEALVRRMQQAGLHDVCYHPLAFGIATLYIGIKRNPGLR